MLFYLYICHCNYPIPITNTTAYHSDLYKQQLNLLIQSRLFIQMARVSGGVVAVVALLLCLIVVSESATCDSVMKDLTPCKSSLKGGAVAESCCKGMRTLNAASKTTAQRKSACECIKKLAKSYKVNAQTAKSMTNHCKVDIGYPISANVDCTK